MAEPLYHLELRSFPHVARVFNLDRSTLDVRYVKPWNEGDAIEYEDRRWPAEKTKLTVLCGPEVTTGQRGLGRGWGEVTRNAEDVTETVLAEIQRGAEARPEVEALKDVLAEVGAGGGLRFPDAVALAAVSHPAWRASEQLALAEQAVWEMLQRGGRAPLAEHRGPVPAERWQEGGRAWGTWAGGAEPLLRRRAPVAGESG